MNKILKDWLSKQKDLEIYAFRFLKDNEYTAELNFFFEIKNRIPIAITAVGSIIYAEIFGEEILFSIIYLDQRLDFHLADSPEDFEKLLKNANSRDFYLHIAHCEIGTYDVSSYSKESKIPALEKAFGPLKTGEIYAYADEFIDSETKGHSVSHWVSARQIEKTAIQDAKIYFARLTKNLQMKLEKTPQNLYKDTYGNSSNMYTELFLISYDVQEDLKQYPPNAIKDIYKCFGKEVLPNLRSINNCSPEYLSHTRRLSYFRQSSYYLDKEANHFLPMLQQNAQLLHIAIEDSANYEDPEGFFQKGSMESFEALSSFPLLKSFQISNIEITHFPEALTNLSHLQAICMIKTDTCSFPESLNGMEQLRQLHFSHCQLDGKLNVLSSLENITHLTLHACGLTSIPEVIKQFSKLEELDLSGNPIGEIPEWIGTFKNLRTINFSNCGLTTFPATIAELENISGIEMKGNAFDALPETLLHLKNKVALEPKFKALYDEKVRKKLEKDGMKPAVFKDFNFKLMVIQTLMYDKELLLPKFDVWQFAETYKDRKIDVDDEGMDVIPEVRAYFEALEVPVVMLDEIEELNGGMDVYHQISPLWGGEDDYYLVNSIKDVKILPNLKKVQFDCLGKKSILSQLEKMGIEAIY